MTTPGKNQSKRAPERNESKEIEEEELVPTGNESSELDDDDEDDDRIPQESLDDQETGRTDRDSDRSNRNDRPRGG